MPRQSRIDAPGALHHIIACGIGRRNIFTDDQNRDNFVDRLETVLEQTRTGCYWSMSELGISMSQLARQLGLSVTAISQSVGRGKRIATEDNFEL